MHRRTFLATVGGAIIACQADEHSDLKALHERCELAWHEGREQEADHLMFQLRDAMAAKGVPEGWHDAWYHVALYAAICGRPM